MTHRFDFLFEEPKENDKPFKPYTRLYLKTSQADEDNNILISQILYANDYDEYIDILIEELQKIKKKLHSKFKL